LVAFVDWNLKLAEDEQEENLMRLKSMMVFGFFAYREI
jgi:hypothetical protein